MVIIMIVNFFNQTKNPQFGCESRIYHHIVSHMTTHQKIEFISDDQLVITVHVYGICVNQTFVIFFIN